MLLALMMAPPSAKRAANERGMNRKTTAITGALIGAAVGVAAGLLIPSNTGKKIKKQMKASTADFYRYLAPRIKRLKTVGEREYKALIDQAAKSYAEVKDISAKEMADLVDSAKDSWGDIKRGL